MDTYAITTIVEEHIDMLKKHGAEIASQFDEGAIHAFRVTIKRLRAFIRLLAPAATAGDTLKFTEEFKALNSTLGMIRNYQLAEAFIHKHAISDASLPAECLKALQTAVAAAKEKVAGLSIEAIIEKEAEHLLQQLPVRLTKVNISKFILRYKTKLISLIMAPYIGNEKLHDTRKILKDFYYNREYIEQQAVLLLPRLFSGEEHLKSWAQVLGDHQDLVTLIAIFEAIPVDHAEPALSVFIQKLKWREQIMKPLLTTHLKQTILHNHRPVHKIKTRLA